MMRRMRFFLWAAAFAAALAITACQVEEPEAPEAPVVTDSVSFSATTEAAATKTALSDDGAGGYNVVWQNGDRITIVDAASHVGIYSTESTSTEGDFNLAEGTAMDPSSTYKAYYPASIYNAGTPTLPAEQTYVAGNIAGSPMYAESNTSSLSFKNLCGIIRLNLKTNQPSIKVQSITLTANEPLSGPISNAATLADDGYAAAVSGSAGVTLDCGAGVDIDNSAYTPFHIAVPENTTGYSNLTITVTTTTGAYQTFTVKSGTRIAVGRSMITTISLTAKDILYDLPATYAALDYLESTGAQYIDTGVSCNYNTHVDIDFMYTGSKVTDYPGGNDKGYYWKEGGSVFGAHGQSLANGIYEYCIWWHGTGLITQPTYTDPLFAVGTRYNVKVLTSNTVSIDGVEKTTNDLGTYNNASNNFALFANYSSMNSRWTYFSVARIYFCKMHDADNVWLRYFVPCIRVSDGKPGMYDRVNDVFYVNGGAGADFNTSSVDLSATETANCYVVPEGGLYKFRATAKGNGLADLAGVSRTTDAASIASASLVWASFSTAVAPTENELIKDIRYNPSDGYVYFSTGDVYKEGNAIVAVKDGSGNILWSWHLWICNYGQYFFTGSNGVKMMTRNLGGLDSGTSSLSFGMYYQWGRKDPFVGPSSGATMAAVYGAAKSIQVGSVSVETAIRNPTNYYVECNTAGRWTDGDHWCSDDTKLTLWSASGKTIFDPCPPGWRTPSFSEITGMGTASSVYTTVNGFGAYGYVNTNGVFVDVSNGTLWSTTVNGSCAKIQVVLGDYSTWDRSPDMGFNIRCVKVE